MHDATHHNGCVVTYICIVSLYSSREHVVGEPVMIKKMDLNTCTLADAEGVTVTPVDFLIPVPAAVSGFAGTLLCRTVTDTYQVQ